MLIVSPLKMPAENCAAERRGGGERGGCWLEVGCALWMAAASGRGCRCDCSCAAAAALGSSCSRPHANAAAEWRSGRFGNARAHLALLRQTEDLGHRPRRRVRLEALDGARREDEHAVRALAAQALLPRERHDVELVPRHVLREDGRRGVAQGQALAVGRDGHVDGAADAGGGAVVREDDVLVPVDLGQVGQHAVVGLHVGDVLELELLREVRVPVAAEALEVDARHRLGAEERPHRHLEGARVRRGHDADVVVLWQADRLDQLLCLRDGRAELGLADLGAVRAAERGVGQRHRRVAWALRARARRELRALRLDGRLGRGRVGDGRREAAQRRAQSASDLRRGAGAS